MPKKRRAAFVSVENLKQAVEDRSVKRQKVASEGKEVPMLTVTPIFCLIIWMKSLKTLKELT